MISCTVCDGSGSVFSHVTGTIECAACDGLGFETRYTEHITCPNCGHQSLDSWDVDFENSDDVLLECGICYEPFMATKIVTVTYITTIGRPINNKPLALR